MRCSPSRRVPDITCGDHAFVMDVGAGAAVKQRRPRAGTPEEPVAALRANASRVLDELGPALTVG
jgi:hypothetical protein